MKVPYAVITGFFEEEGANLDSSEGGRVTSILVLFEEKSVLSSRVVNDCLQRKAVLKFCCRAI